MSNPTRSRKTKGIQPRLLHAVVSLRRYLEENITQMETCQKKASRRGGFKRYWREGAKKMKVHLKTVKALERQTQANRTKLTDAHGDADKRGARGEGLTEDSRRARCSDLVRPRLRLARLILENLALGRGFSVREREAVEKSSAKQLRVALPHLLGLKQRQVPILHLLEG